MLWSGCLFQAELLEAHNHRAVGSRVDMGNLRLSTQLAPNGSGPFVDQIGGHSYNLRGSNPPLLPEGGVIGVKLPEMVVKPLCRTLPCRHSRQDPDMVAFCHIGADDELSDSAPA